MISGIPSTKYSDKGNRINESANCKEERSILPLLIPIIAMVVVVILISYILFSLLRKHKRKHPEMRTAELNDNR